MTDKPVRDYDKFMLRFPDGMRDAVAERAKANGRSMNSEIIQIIEDALSGRVNPLADDDEVEKIYLELISNGDEPITQEQFDLSNEKIDWLIDVFMDRVYQDSKRFKKLLKMKGLNRKDLDL